MIPTEPLPDKPRIAGGFDFQAKQPDKSRFCSKRRRTSTTNLRRRNARPAAAPLPDRRVRISNRGDHHKPDRGKSANISARFLAISSAEGAGPYFASKPRREWIGSRTGALPPSASIALIAARTSASVVRTVRLCPLFDALDLRRASLVGVSMGGGVALGFALQAPDRVERLALINSACLDRNPRRADGLVPRAHPRTKRHRMVVF